MMKPPGYALSRLQEVTNLPTLPSILVEILNNLQNPNVNFETLKQIVSQDPAIAARLLRVANSAYFGRREPTGSLETAFLILGTNALVLIVSSIGVVNVFAETASTRFDRRVLWKHCVATASTVRYLSRKLNIEERVAMDLSTAGLLHDIGHIIIDQYFPNEFKKILAGVEKGGDPLELEREHLGNDHTELSSYLATHWRFSQKLIDVLRWHHDPHQYQGDTSHLQLVRLADRICSWRDADEPPVSALELVANPNLLEPILPYVHPVELKKYAESFTDAKPEFERITALVDSMYT